jgi:hypothetical protein
LISELDLDVINVRILAASNRDLNAEVEATSSALWERPGRQDPRR